MTVKVEDLAFGGEGVARVDGFVLFVPFVIPGEEIEAEVTEVKRTFARGRVSRVVQASPDRVSPQCEYFEKCGGCQYQHLAYPRQVELKQKQIADLIVRIGGFSASCVAPVVPCPRPYHYRNRIMIRSQWNKPEQKLNIGFIEAQGRFVVDIDHCEIAEPDLSAKIAEVRANPPPKGGIKVVLRIHPEGWTVPKDSFFQNNFHLLPQLIETLRLALAESGTRYLIDAYCGVGFLAIELADTIDQFVGIELDRLAIRAARENAQRRGVGNGQFLDGRAEDLLPSQLARFQPEATTVLLDPPRTGCDPEFIQLLRQARPRQVLYVSCHPATLARDLNQLCADGVFGLVRVTPFDLFPQTQHVECVADVRLTGSMSESG